MQNADIPKAVIYQRLLVNTKFIAFYEGTVRKLIVWLDLAYLFQYSVLGERCFKAMAVKGKEKRKKLIHI
jgi:hypothetical protein